MPRSAPPPPSTCWDFTGGTGTWGTGRVGREGWSPEGRGDKGAVRPSPIYKLVKNPRGIFKPNKQGGEGEGWSPNDRILSEDVSGQNEQDLMDQQVLLAGRKKKSKPSHSPS